jgi:hypothetical protein
MGAKGNASFVQAFSGVATRAGRGLPGFDGDP